MQRTYLLLTFLAMLPAVSMSGAVVTSSLELPFSQTVLAPINSTQSETVMLAGSLHLVTQVTAPTVPCPPGGACQVPVSVNLNLSGVSGTGQTTGQVYQLTGATQSSGSTALPGAFYLQGGFRLIPGNPVIPGNPIIPGNPVHLLVFVNVDQQGTATSAATTPPGLVSWWQGEGGALDTLGANPGTLNGPVGFVPGKVGQAFDFSANLSLQPYVQVMNSVSLQPATVTVAAWVKHAGSPGIDQYIVSKGAQACVAASYAMYSGAAGGLLFYVFDGATIAASPDAGDGLWDGNWHFVVGTYDGAAVRLYVDGLQVGSGTQVSIPINYFLRDNSNFYIGAYLGTCNLGFPGPIDEVQLYNRALDAAEIQSLYLSTR